MDLRGGKGRATDFLFGTVLFLCSFSFAFGLTVEEEHEKFLEQISQSKPNATRNEVVREYLRQLQVKHSSLKLLSEEETRMLPLGSNAIVKSERSPEKEVRQLFSIVSQDPDDPLFGKPLHYLAYTAATDRMEIISLMRDKEDPSLLWNDFAVLDNFSQRGAAHFPINFSRSSCLTCHQNEGSQFTPSPWAEAGGLGPDSPLPKEDLIAERLFNSSYDRDVRRGNRILQASKMCQALGKNSSLEERRFLLLLAFMANSVNEPQIFERLGEEEVASLNKDAKLLKGLVENFWPKDNFAVVSSVIPDRDPESKSGFLVIEPHPNKDSGDEAIRLGLLHYIDSESRTTDLLSLNSTGHTRTLAVPESNPAIKATQRRPLTHAITMDARGLMNLLDIPLFEVCFGLRLPKQGVALEFLIQDIIQNKSFDAMLASWPSSTNKEDRKNLVESAFKRFQSNYVDQLIVSRLSQVKGNLEEDAKGSGLHGPALVQEFCADCHGPGKKNEIDLSVLQTYSDAEGISASDYLRKETMPPASHAREHRPMTAAERAALLKYLEKK